MGTFSLISGLLVKTFLPENLIISIRGVEIASFKYYWAKEEKESHKEEWSIIALKFIINIQNVRNLQIAIKLKLELVEI